MCGNKKNLRFGILLYVLLSWSVYCNCQLFSFPEKIKEFLKHFFTPLDDYILAEQEKLNSLTRIQGKLKSISSWCNNNGYLDHPINQFHLIKRLNVEWKNVENILKTNNQTDLLLMFYSKHNFSKKLDIESFTKELLKLQNFYKLSTEQMVHGVIKNFTSIYPLTIEDFYYIGKVAFENRKYYLCYSWMNSVLGAITNQSSSINILDVLDHAIYCSTKLRFYGKVIELLEKKFQLQPFNITHLKSIQFYRLLTKKEKKMSSSEDSVWKYESSSNSIKPKYSDLCRSPQFLSTNKKSKNLKCFYWTNYKHPQLVIRPAKLEVISKSPWLARFYDVISDSDIEEIKDLARPKLETAMVYSDGKPKVERDRISQYAWLYYRNHTVVAKISRRITYITGLLLESSELLQVANYGMGGLFTPHVDYLQHHVSNQPDGDRIATTLIYLNGVKYGGNTVFIKPAIAVEPIKGSAIMWYNLYPSGKGNSNTHHAACPVVIGEKWVANMWFRERGQLIQKCPSKS